MGAGKKTKIIAGILGVAALAFLGLSGPVRESSGAGDVRPLFGEVKVQLSSGRYAQDSRMLTAVLESGETEFLYLFDKMEAADFSGSSCYEEIAAWARENPQVTVKYTVTLPDGQEYDNSTQSVDLSALPVGTVQEAVRALSCLPELSLVTLGNVGGEGSSLSLEDVAALRTALPDVGFDFTLDLLGQSVEPDTRSVDLSSLGSDPEQLTEAAAVLACLPELEEVKLGSQSSSDLSWDDINMLAKACPNAALNFSFSLYGQELNLNAESLDFNHTEISDEGEEIRKILPLMRNCTYLDMDYCGVSNEAMAQIRDENPNVEVVWRIWFGENYSVRTDVERILASKPTVGGMISDASVLQYCTKVKYLDLGHNDDLSDLSFVSTMPELEVLIIAMTDISDLSPLANCPNMEYLEIQETNISDLSPLAGLTNLAHLNICNQENITDASPLYGLSKLDRLWIGCNTPIPEGQVTKLRESLPDCDINTTTNDPHGEAWRYSAYDPEEPKYYWVPRHELLREQMGYNYQEYSFYWLDPKCGDPAPAEYAGMFGKEVYGLE